MMVGTGGEEAKREGGSCACRKLLKEGEMFEALVSPSIIKITELICSFKIQMGA